MTSFLLWYIYWVEYHCFKALITSNIYMLPYVYITRRVGCHQHNFLTGSRFREMPASPLLLSIFLNHIGSQMPSKWRSFGILLDIPFSEMDTYPSQNCVDCFARVFDTWQKKGSPEFSWKTVIDVLESPLLEERQLAQKVRQMIAARCETGNNWTICSCRVLYSLLLFALLLIYTSNLYATFFLSFMWFYLTMIGLLAISLSMFIAVVEDAAARLKIPFD